GLPTHRKLAHLWPDSIEAVGECVGPAGRWLKQWFVMWRYLWTPGHVAHPELHHGLGGRRRSRIGIWFWWLAQVCRRRPKRIVAVPDTGRILVLELYIAAHQVPWPQHSRYWPGFCLRVWWYRA